MFEKLTLKEKYNILIQVAIVGSFIGIGFLVNHALRISGLYMDDLYMWSTYGEQSFLEYVFPVGSTRFRPVYWFVAWIELGIIRYHITWIVPINILIAAATAYFIYLFAKEISQMPWVAYGMGVMFLVSRFAYYNIGQLLGLMEAMGIIFSLLIAHFLYQYICYERNARYYVALLFYILICFTHERYIVVLPVFFLAILARRTKDLFACVSAILASAGIIVLRTLTTGKVVPAGTGGTYVTDTFSVKNMFGSVLDEILYMFGVNAGPEHLNGMTWAQTPLPIKILVYMGGVVAIFIVYKFIRSLYVLYSKKIKIDTIIWLTVFFIFFIGGTILSSAVTIRVEMRWIYAPYVFMLLLVSLMMGTWKRAKEIRIQEKVLIQYLPLATVTLWMILMIPVELYGRTKYDGIYLFPNQKRYNSLADETYWKYGDDIFGKEIYIIGNSYKMSDFTAKTFFKVYDRKRKAEGTVVKHISSVKELGQIRSNMIVLKEDPAHNVFSDVTDAYRDLKCEIVKGYYRDGWMEQEAKINVMTGANGQIDLEFMYPGVLDGKQNITISVDGKEPETFDMENNIENKSYKVNPYSIVTLQFDNDFVYPDAKQQRGELPLSVIMNVTTS